MASCGKIVYGNLGASARVVNDSARCGKVVPESIDAESRVEMKSQDVIKQRCTGEKNLPVLPVPDGEDNVFFLNFRQRAILHQIVKYLPS